MMRNALFTRFLIGFPLLLSSMAGVAKQEKVVRVFSAGEPLSEYIAGDIDYVEVQDMLPAPRNVKAVFSESSVIINWESLEEAVYKVYRAADNLNFSEIATDIETSEFIDTNPLVGNNYYKVRAIADGIESVASSSVNVFIPHAAGIADEVQDIRDDLAVMLGNREEKHLTPFPEGPASEYFRNLYVVSNIPFEREGILKKIQIGSQAGIPEDAGEFTLYLGHIDQRGLLINPRRYSYPLTGVSAAVDDSGILAIDLREKAIRVHEGEVICFFSGENMAGSGNSLLIGRKDSESGNVLVASEILGVFEPSYDFSLLEYDVTYFDAGFAGKEEVAAISENISTLSSLLNSAYILRDEVTGDNYRLIVRNGQLLLKPTNYKRTMFVGSSFVTHVASEEVGWHYDGGMAPSIPEHSLPSLVLKGLMERDGNCSMSIVPSLNWERNYNNEAYDFNDSFRPALEKENPDAVFMNISGNSTWTEDFRPACGQLIRDIRSVCPATDIFIAASWHGGQKAADLRSACMENGATYVDLSSLKVAENVWKAGDYYISGADAGYYPLYEIVTWHPNDTGCLRMANLYLESAGYVGLNLMHNIDLVSSGVGKASIPNPLWPEEGVVTVRIESGEVENVVVSTASGEEIPATLRVNNQNPSYSTFYTFIMPHADVKVEVIFK